MSRPRAWQSRAEEKRLLPQLDEPRDTEGPACAYVCACVSRDAGTCVRLRFGLATEEGERCTCLCHQWPDEG